MADYYPLIAKAVASLPQSTPESRGAIYERARNALITQLNKLDPPVPAEAIEREEKSLASAVARLEAEFGPELEATAPPQEESSLPAKSDDHSPQAANSPSEPEETSANSVKERPSENRREAFEQAPVPTHPARETPKLFGSSFGKPPMSKNKVPEPVPPIFPQPARDLKLPQLAAKEEKNLLPAEDEEEAGQETNKIKQGPMLPEQASSAKAAAGLISGKRAGDSECADPPSPLAQIQIRSEAQRPFAPQPKAEPGPPRRVWIFGFVLAVIVSLVAVAAWNLRDRPETLLRTAKIAAPNTGDQAPRGKISDRLEGGQTPDVQAPSLANGSEAGNTPAETQTQIAGAPAETPLAMKGGAAPNDVALTQHRAALLVEAPDDPAKVKTMTGSVQWRVDNAANGPDQAISAEVRADIVIPDAKFQASMVFQKNFDPSLPASHTIKITFVQEPGSTVSAVQQISLPQMRRQDAATGETLNGVPVPIMENSFLIGLSRGTAEPTNLNLIQSHEWMDFPMLLANGRIAKLTFEKGPEGSSALDDAIASWAAEP